MLLDVRKALVWGTIVAALLSAVWLGATDGSLSRLGTDRALEQQPRKAPALLIKRSAPAPVATSSAH